MESTVVFEEKISLSPLEFNKLRGASIEELLLDKFRRANEGRCSIHGWVVPGSLKILSRSMAHIEGGRFTGDLVSWVQVEGDIIYPTDGVHLNALVLKKNKMGIFAMYQNAIQVMIPRDLHIGNEEYDSIQIGDTIEIELKKSRFQVNDEHILSVGLFISKVSSLNEEKTVKPRNSEELPKLNVKYDVEIDEEESEPEGEEKPKSEPEEEEEEGSPDEGEVDLEIL
jgi:hypothetical protein